VASYYLLGVHPFVHSFEDRPYQDRPYEGHHSVRLACVEASYLGVHLAFGLDDQDVDQGQDHRAYDEVTSFHYHLD
jgi:hypothetical protein